MAAPNGKHHAKQVSGIKIHYVEDGDAPLVLLLHGFPDAWFAWRYQIPTLAGRNRVIALHPFGYGETEEATVSYDKRTMARDVRELLRRLGFEKATIVAHDRGARVAKDYADAIDGLVVMDNIPTRIIFETRSPRS